MKIRKRSAAAGSRSRSASGTRAPSRAAWCRAAGSPATGSRRSSGSTTTALTVVEPTSSPTNETFVVRGSRLADRHQATPRPDRRCDGAGTRRRACSSAHVRPGSSRRSPMRSLGVRAPVYSGLAGRDARRRTRGPRRGSCRWSRATSSNSCLALTRASPSAICTRLCALISPSPDVSIGR